MSIVEKAVQKLIIQPEAPATAPAAETAPSHPSSTVERLHERKREPEQREETTTAWPLDLTALKRIGLLPADDEAERRLADELRGVKRPLLANAVDRREETLIRGKRIMLTSAEAGEGKTFAAVNLALSLARETDFEVLLIDGDIPKSDITSVFGLSGKPGLMDVLADETLAPADVIVRTDVPNLLVLPAGERHLLAAELFRSRRMEHVLDELEGRNKRRLLVFDSSPLLATSESQVLASHMGQVVLVVAASRTRRQEVTSALRRLSELQYVGLLLNMSRLPATENYYNRHSLYLRALKGDD